ncbi:MAG TPA: hypothetical protein VEZ14_05000 [Dehalococcoidia bacterium]|nr:hypothetical protein [Dehalococcoidia bacterium]
MNTIILTGMAWAASLKDAIKSQISSERGQDLFEYAVLGGAIAVVAAIALFAVGNKLDFSVMRNRINDCITFDPACGNW